MSRPRPYIFLSIFLILLTILPTGVHAFGAGSIPGFAYLHDRAFRHGDIEDLLTTLAKSPHHHTGGSGGFVNFFLTLFDKGLVAVLKGNAAQTFSKSDVRRIYFGNWLRDYSQAIDVAGLSKMTLDTLLIIVQALGFVSFGFTTREFHITPERLGVYLPVEHIDNPKGYADDAQNYDPRLRPPVNPEELEIDLTNGMKKYMATEGHTWDTSTAHIRRTLRTCIALGRSVHGKSAGGRRIHREGEGEVEGDNKDKEKGDSDPDDCEEMWEAFRLLGSALHTLEDLLAHSNWCEIALRKLGCSEVFCHVGDEVIIRTPSGPAPPLVTGTFGSADFIHSVLGEASDQLSQASIVDLTAHMEEAENNTSFSSLRELLSHLPEAINPGQKAATSEDLERRSEARRSGTLVPRRRGPRGQASFEEEGEEGEEEGEEEGKEEGTEEEKEKEKEKEEMLDLSDYAPSEETQEFIWDVLSWRDDLVRAILSTIESIPGLSELIDELLDVINECVYTLLSPVLIPLAKEVTLALKEQSQAVINTEQQYEVFDNPKASDPTHSILAKDHVDLILNEPAGRVAKVVVEHTIGLVVSAWYDEEDEQDIDRVINEILAAFFHPYFTSPKSKIQNDMITKMKVWLDGFTIEDRGIIISSLNKEAIREGKNKRIPSPPASITADTMSTFSGSSYAYDLDHEYDSGYDSPNPNPNPNLIHQSIEEGEEGTEQPIDNAVPTERERHEEEHIRDLRRDYEAVLSNPNTSSSAKRNAAEMLRTLPLPNPYVIHDVSGTNREVRPPDEGTPLENTPPLRRRRTSRLTGPAGQRRLRRRKRVYDSEDDLSSLSSDSGFLSRWF